LAGRLLLIGALGVSIAIVVVGACTPQAVPPTPTTATPTVAPTTAAPTTARPSPTASPTPSPSPSPIATGTGAPPPACPTLSGGDASAQAQLTAVRAAHQTGFDRVVFEFGPTNPSIGTYALPPYEVSVVSQFVGGGSGRTVPVDGNAFLQIRFRNASTVDPSTGAQTYSQTDLHPALPLVRNVKMIDDFERVMTWGLGLEHIACAKISQLSSPIRLVVDLPTPP
jgi:hypothetical protein